MLCFFFLSALFLGMSLEGLFLVVLHDIILLYENMHVIKGNKKAPSATGMERGLKINPGKSNYVLGLKLSLCINALKLLR